MSAPLLSLRDVFCVHRTPDGDVAALQGASLDVPTGQLACVLGPSGAGKSTLLRVIAGLQSPAAGAVLVAGRDIGRLPERERARLRRRHVGFVAQSAATVLLPDADELLTATGLADQRRARPAELSGGERQRLALCAAIAHRPALLLADEPTAELDSASAASARAVIAQLTRETGLTALVVSHDPATASIAQRTLVIRDGRIAADAPGGGDPELVVDRGGWVRLPEELRAQAGIVNRVRARAQGGRVILAAAPGDGDRPGAPADARAPGAVIVGDRPGSPEPSLTPEPPSAPAAAPAPRRPVVLELRAVTRTLGRGRERRDVVREVTFAFPAGGLTVITGPSGSGKTTLMRLLAGLDRADGGEVILDGRDLGGADEEELAALRRQRIGYLPQDPQPIGFLGAAENVVLALRLRGFDAHSAAAAARQAIAAVGLADRARQRVARMSAGEAQRLALARALAGARGLLLVDEPSSRLDRANAARVAELLAAGAERGGQTVICATHDPDLVRRAGAALEL